MGIKSKSTKYLFLLTFFAISFFAFSSRASADYYAQGILESKNMLSGADVTAISSFVVTATVPANTTVKVKFSQDKVNYYNSSGVKDGWDSCSNGTTNVNLSGRGWSGGILFYKLQLTSTNIAATPVVSEVQVDYTGTAVPPISGITYYNQGILESKNMLSGANVTAINGFLVTATLPPGTTASVKFSQDKVNYYNSSGVKDGWDSCVNGTTNINLSGRGWSGGSLFYKIKLESLIDNALVPKVSEVSVSYDGGVAPPPSGSTYNSPGVLVSTDLLFGSGVKFNKGNDSFGWEITSLPFGTTVEAQFSRDGTTWYNSAGTLWGWDTLSARRHMSDGDCLNLSSLGWEGAASFYYKLRLSTNIDNTTSPIVAEAGLFKFSKIDSSTAPVGSKITVNGSQADKMTSGLLGIWTFDGPDVNIQTNTATDRSGHNHNGTIVGAAQAVGKNGQALDFNGTTNHVSCGNVGSGIKTISFWMKADTITSRKILDFDGTKQIEIDGTSHIVATGFPSATIYVDGAVGSVINPDWHFITIADSAGVNGSAVDFGKVGAGYFDGKLDEIRLYNRAFSASETKDLYNLGNVKIVP